MDATSASTIDRLDASLADATSLPTTNDEVTLITTLYRTLAGGDAPDPRDLATATGLDAGFVAERLASWPGVYRAGDGSIVGFWGLTVAEMPPHRMRFADGPDVNAWCAWDPLFVAPIVGDADVQTVDPVTGDPIRYQVGPTGVHGTDASQVMSFLEPADTWDGDVITSFCHYVLHFTDHSTGSAWVDQHPGTFLLSLEQAAELGRRHARRLTTPAPGSP